MNTKRPALAIDLGSTTIAMALLFGSRICHLPSVCNPGRLHGSDVISRMNNVTKQGLSEKIKNDMWEAVLSSLKCAGYSPDELSWIVASGNTPMMHMLFGYDVSGMLDAPFTPQTLSLQEKRLSAIISGTANTSIISMPCISAFVGGDIVSGIYALDLDKASDPEMLIDLGTNGEIVLSSSKRLYATSVACGPAFEGGNISIGMAASAGAICNVSIKKGFSRLSVIGQDTDPRGICGSGIIDAVFEMYGDGIIDRHGTFKNELLRRNGFCLYHSVPAKNLILSQDDIRNFQMAKSAIRSGIDALLSCCGIMPSDIKKCYIAGSFGEHIDIKKASGIGMFPEALTGRIISAGNTSLSGAVRLAKNPADISRLISIAGHTVSISLADDDGFKDGYIANMDL